jgi:hypothetical protein
MADLLKSSNYYPNRYLIIMKSKTAKVMSNICLIFVKYVNTMNCFFGGANCTPNEKYLPITDGDTFKNILGMIVRKSGTPTMS